MQMIKKRTNKRKAKIKKMLPLQSTLSLVLQTTKNIKMNTLSEIL